MLEQSKVYEDDPGWLLQGPPLLDAVLIACPLEQSQLKLSLPKPPVIPPRKYQVTNTFYVRAGSPVLTFNPAPPGDPSLDLSRCAVG